MTEKTKLLSLAAEKASSNKELIGFLIKAYLDFENISTQEILAQLACSEENFYKLCLCQAPAIELADFLSRLNRICEYTHTPVMEVNKIIKRANAILKFSDNGISSDGYLMAARDKHNKSNDQQ